MEDALIPHFIYLEKSLSPARFKHSLGVMKVMTDLAPIYGINTSAARLAGLAHDAGKELSDSQMLEIAQRMHLPLEHPQDRHPLYLHGPASAYVAQHDMGIRDPLVLEAIAHHAYMLDGPVRSPVFIWCLRFADLLESGRDWDDMRARTEPLVYAGKLTEAAFLLIDWLIPFLESVGISPHPRQRLLRQALWALHSNPVVPPIHKVPV